MLSFDLDPRPLSECSHPVATRQSHIVEINCAPAPQRAISIVTLRGHESVDIEIPKKVFAHELRYL